MTLLQHPAGATAPPARSADSRTPLLPSVVTAAATAWLLGLLLAEGLVLLAWAADARGGSGALAASRAGALVWLVAHRVPVALGAGSYGLAPLGLTLVIGLLLARAGAQVVRTTHPPTTAAMFVAAAGVAVPYAVLAALVTGLAGGPGARPGPVAGLAMSFAVGVACAAAGGAHAWGRRRLLAGLPEPVGAVLTAAAAAVWVLVATGALAMTASLVAHVDRAGELARSVRPGVAGGALLLVLCLAYAPNAVVWAASYAVGTGFAVGVGSSVAPAGVRLGAVPALPLLAALPAAGDAPRWSLLLLLGPAVAGVVGGVVLVRRLPGLTPAGGGIWALAVAAVAGVAVGLACWLSGGPAGPGRLAVAGPSPWLTGLAAGEWIGLFGAVSAWVTARRRRRLVPDRADQRRAGR